jgi:hypothetical protein
VKCHESGKDSLWDTGHAGRLVRGRGMLLPSEQHVERSIIVNADPAEVFSLVNDYREFNKWSPWAMAGPD